MSGTEIETVSPEQSAGALARSRGVNMTVRARAPLRLGLAGGGTDLSAYSDRFGGAVLNATIDRFAYAFVSARDDGQVVFHARDLAMVETLEARAPLQGSNLLLHRGVYDRFVRDHNGGVPISITVSTTIDAPLGSGLGASSALTVALIAAYADFLDVPLGPYEIAKLAWEIERVDLSLAGGKQDQYAAAFGGVNYIEFMDSGQVIVNPLSVSQAILAEFEMSLVLCFSGQSRASDSIVREQSQRVASNAERTLDAMHSLKVDARDMKVALLSGDIEDVSSILRRSWLAKQRTAEIISTSTIASLYEVAIANGAVSGKVSGAGGGGFMMFLVPPEERLGLIQALREAGGHAEPVKFIDQGVRCWSAVVHDTTGLAVAKRARR